MLHARRALALFCRKHFWQFLPKHVVGFKMVFKNQSSFFSEKNFAETNQHSRVEQAFFSKCSWEGSPHMDIHAAGLGVFAFCYMYMSTHPNLECPIGCPQCKPAHSNHAPHPPSTSNPEHPHTRGSTLSKQESPAHPTKGRNPQKVESKRLVESNSVGNKENNKINFIARMRSWNVLRTCWATTFCKTGDGHFKRAHCIQYKRPQCFLEHAGRG